MKNLGKKIAAFILVATAATCSLAMVGCNGGYREHRHEFEYVYNNDATCGQDGTKTGKCKYCDKTETTIEMGSATGKHEYDGYKCKVCGDYSPDAPVTEGLEFITYVSNCGVKGIGSATATEIMIPDKYNGLPVTDICYEAFKNCDSITKVIVPPTVEYIDAYAFSYCVNLKEVVIPSSVKRIEKYAFSGCRSLTDIAIPEKVTTIEAGTFSSCSGLTSIVIPKSITKIESSAFSRCFNLESAVIPKSVAAMEADVFYECTKLTVLCEATSAPAGWDSEWHRIYNDEEKDLTAHCDVTWGYKA